MNIFSDTKDIAIINYINHHEERIDVRCLEIEEHIRFNDEEALEIIKTKCMIEYSIQLKGFEKEKRDNCIMMLKREGYRQGSLSA